MVTSSKKCGCPFKLHVKPVVGGECKVFGSKFECVWMENEDNNNGVQVGLKNEGLER